MAMTDEEKAALVRTLLGEDPGDAVVEGYLGVARDLILEARNPFSADPTAENWEARYDRLQCEVAVELVARRGAEGQTAHKENGVDRTWADAGVSSALIGRVVPRARVVSL